ncbi:MAG: Smr/MutS family protein [Ginsengibacter sp.]
MKYTVGDTILVLHSNEEGEVTEIMNEKMVMIKVDKVQFPVYTDQIDFPYFKRFTEKRKEVKKKETVYIDQLQKEKKVDKAKVATGMWLSFLPVFDKDVFDDDVVQKFKMHLLNHTNDTLNFVYEVNFKGNPDFNLTNVIHPFSDFYLHDIAFEEMNDAPRFEFDFTLQPPDKKRAEHFEANLKIKAKILFKKIEEMRLKNEPSFTINLYESYPDKIEEVAPDYNYSGGLFYNVKRIKEKLPPARSVVDLHIEKLTDNYKTLSNFEILTIQLNHFEKFYHLAVINRQPNLIVIHGVGTGKLRMEIHEILKLKREVKSFANQYHPNFGFGATEIFFQY